MASGSSDDNTRIRDQIQFYRLEWARKTSLYEKQL